MKWILKTLIWPFSVALLLVILAETGAEFGWFGPGVAFALQVTGFIVFAATTAFLFLRLVAWSVDPDAKIEDSFGPFYSLMSVLFGGFLLGLGFAFIYSGVENLLTISCINTARDRWDYLYFSMTTLTTLGYGDLKPVGVCRLVSVTQAVLGYAWLGFSVAVISSEFKRR